MDNLRFRQNQKLGRVLSDGTIQRYQNGRIIEYSVVQDTPSHATEIAVDYWFASPNPSGIKPINYPNHTVRMILGTNEVVDLNEHKKTHLENFSS